MLVVHFLESILVEVYWTLRVLLVLWCALLHHLRHVCCLCTLGKVTESLSGKELIYWRIVSRSQIQFFDLVLETRKSIILAPLIVIIGVSVWRIRSISLLLVCEWLHNLVVAHWHVSSL